MSRNSSISDIQFPVFNNNYCYLSSLDVLQSPKQAAAVVKDEKVEFL